MMLRFLVVIVVLVQGSATYAADMVVSPPIQSTNTQLEVAAGNFTQ
jgi:hypothetical protein